MTTRGPDINSGLITNWIPLTTPGPVSLLAECSSAIYYEPGAVSKLIAFDPYYGQWVDSAVKCLVKEQSLWWNQHSDGVTTDINLGPFACPAGYTTATASSLNPQSTVIGCCPSGYNFQGTLLPAAVLGQCLSGLSIGQTIVAKSAFSGFTWYDTTATITASSMNVFGVHINGFLFANAAATTPASALASTTAPGTVTVSAQVTPSRTQASTTSALAETATAAATSLSSRATVGIAVGVSLAIVTFIALVAIVFLLRRRLQAASKRRASRLIEPMSHVPIPLLERRDEPRIYEALNKNDAEYGEPSEMWVSPSQGG